MSGETKKELKRIIEGLKATYGNTEKILDKLKFIKWYKSFFWAELGIIIIIILWLILLSIILLK